MKRDTQRWRIHKITGPGEPFCGWWGAFHPEGPDALPMLGTDLVAVFPTWQQCVDELSTFLNTGKWAW